ncbi:TetR family transcriptional regulator C-terminal domain-containing protein [Alteraurantiacibacter buctensis]|uniref:TetR family transcriptional regulator n=1 Tax=Alteraurantiacibacter buctensis TaxID=1503981 RepID=A0A844YVY5_9SPHN|nr:TetR family transcriptional regulator C-terminal domain-containing protein [Alteraurantiacibacter buctensis]MXO71098.1 TetR family transcriptional regulator [Alteraurantiacibacter buctensis]
MGRANFVREDADTRRQSLIAACAACLAEEGARGVSVRSICRRAGVSAGLLTHYFAGIDELILATYRDTTRKVTEATDAAVAAAGSDPRARLKAYVTASLRPPLLDPQLLATWLAFWSMMTSNVAVAQVHGETYGEFRRGLEDLLRECCGGRQGVDDLRLAAIGITALVDGLWLELCLDQRGPFTSEEAEKLAQVQLDALLAREGWAGQTG